MRVVSPSILISFFAGVFAYGIDAATSVDDAVHFDAQRRTLYVPATMTGLAPGEPVEFLLVHQDSAKDYEALALTSIPPSSIDRALRSAGLAPGRPGGLNEHGVPLWPKGPRARVDVAPGRHTTEDSTTRWTNAESLLLDEKRGKPLSTAGLVFIGSQRLVPEGAKDGDGMCSADVRSPRAVVALYNEPHAVLQIPFQAPQGEMYARFTPNPDARFDQGQVVTFRFRPVSPPGEHLAVDLAMTVSPNTAAKEARKQHCVLTNADGESLLERTHVSNALELFRSLRERGTIPFVTVSFSPALPLATVAESAKLLAMLDVPDGIRVEPPDGGDLYYRAFLPEPKWRERRKRMAQPYELVLHQTENGSPSGTLRVIEQVWKTNEIDYDLTVREIAVTDTEELAAAMKRREPDWESLFVYAPKELPYGDLLAFLSAARQVYPTMYVFLAER